MVNGINPTVQGVFGVRDLSNALSQNTKDNAKAFQNMFKFGTQVYDYAQSRGQANDMEKATNEKASLNAQLESDMALLQKLESELASLKGGV